MAEQYSWISANNEGYSAGKFSDVDGNIMPWSRSTVADGKWLNREMLLPFSGRDQYLLDSLNQTYDECSAFSGYLNEEIRIINARADVIDGDGSHDAFTARSAELVSGVDISDRDVIKILNDVGTDIPVWIYNTESNEYVESAVSPSNQQTYYRWLSAVNVGPSGWEYVGDLEPYYKNVDLIENSIKFENTAPERNYTIKTDLNRFIQMSADGNTGTIGITDDFISSASQVYNALSSISGINEGSISGPKVNHTVSNYSLAQGSANSASYDSFAQGEKNEANGQSIAAGLSNYAKSQSQALGFTNSATNNGFAAGSNNSATLAASFAQGSTNYAYNSSFAQGTSNSALTQAFAQGKNNSADYDAFAQGLSAFANAESLAQGTEVIAKNKSFAQGSKNNADIYGFAQGTNCSANTKALAQGSNITAYDDAIAQGEYISANERSIAQGYNITATTTGFAQGDKCKANNIALAQGQYASANDYSMAQGQKVYANYVSFAEGEVASAKSVSFAQGNDVIADGYSFVQGHMASATNMSMAQGHNGVIAYQTSFAQGEQASAKDRGMAQGLNANANDNSFAQGYDVTATTAAFAQGNTVKSNYYSISQGLRTVADNYSISQGTNTSAQYYSIAQGNATTADDYSQSFGRGTKMLHSGMAIGTYNKSDNIPFVIGNGTSDNNRSDLFLINRNGDVSAKGDISAKNFYINGNPIDGIIGSAKSGAAASAWIVSNGTTFMPKSQTFNAKGNPNNFNTTFSYTGFTLSAGEGVGFYNAGTNSLGISAQAGIPDGTLTYTMMYSQGGTPHLQDFNISSLNINNYRMTGQNTDYINLNVTASNGTTASFALWPEDTSLTSLPVPATLIPVVDPLNIKQKKYMKVSDLNIGNYVSAGDNQKLTIMSAENLTLANMQPGVIYLV